MEYAESWPDAVWDGNHVPFTGTGCKALYDVLQKSLCLTLICTAIDTLLVIAVFMPATAVCCLPCLAVAVCADLLAKIARFCVGIWGLVVVATTDRAACGDCGSLYTTSWWIFLGFLLVQLGFCCCKCCFAKPPVTDEEKMRLTA